MYGDGVAELPRHRLRTVHRDLTVVDRDDQPLAVLGRALHDAGLTVHHTELVVVLGLDDLVAVEEVALPDLPATALDLLFTLNRVLDGHVDGIGTDRAHTLWDDDLRVVEEVVLIGVVAEDVREPIELVLEDFEQRGDELTGLGTN